MSQSGQPLVSCVDGARAPPAKLAWSCLHYEMITRDVAGDAKCSFDPMHDEFGACGGPCPLGEYDRNPMLQWVSPTGYCSVLGFSVRQSPFHSAPGHCAKC